MSILASTSIESGDFQLINPDQTPDKKKLKSKKINRTSPDITKTNSNNNTTNMEDDIIKAQSSDYATDNSTNTSLKIHTVNSKSERLDRRTSYDNAFDMELMDIENKIQRSIAIAELKAKHNSKIESKDLKSDSKIENKVDSSNGKVDSGNSSSRTDDKGNKIHRLDHATSSARMISKAGSRAPSKIVSRTNSISNIINNSTLDPEKYLNATITPHAPTPHTPIGSTVASLASAASAVAGSRKNSSAQRRLTFPPLEYKILSQDVFKDRLSDSGKKLFFMLIFFVAFCRCCCLVFYCLF